MPQPRNAFYAQSGGVTAVINASAAGVIEAARAHPEAIGTLYAGSNGILGALHEELIDTSQMSDADVAALRHTPAGVFGSCRYKLKGFDRNQAEYERLIEVFKAFDIGYFFYNGGGDSADTCLKISQLGSRMGYPIQAVHVPKTMDNDLPLTDTCPGFGSVAKYTAVSIAEASLDIASMARSSTKVFILEVMGRHAGWTAAAGGLAAQQPGDGPQILLFPEITFDPERFLAKVDETVKRYGWCTVVASEGITNSDGTLFAEAGGTDAFGHKQLGGVAARLAALVKERLGYKHHFAVADYLMRAARHIASATDLEQSYAVGRAAVEKAVAGASGIMVTVQRDSDSPYAWSVGEAPLEQVANTERMMPREFISEDGFHITEACRRYMLPLIQGEAPPPFENGLPRYLRFRPTLVAPRTERVFEVA
ncbi:6-phosphofructokinase [Algiphilus sp.]|uniref:6-phosphofructokinase n=1 Tax=Algiphilus sp. TaxID=1872431 RepID=UPI001CA60071|nr:6-phosphofructokinase [Algiphilus sp.]MBY8965575.1 6-phosphofructokinase [Algiphilus acroporae]MCI5062528.1 6-phosphofructokinase [Algiphilus sp.]MCI5102682.1 6-phosphofructokinase [Algiphilus sp.]MCR9090680.1 6-phosphofructokinase [Pseudomonadota bacterium]